MSFEIQRQKYRHVIQSFCVTGTVVAWVYVITLDFRGKNGSLGIVRKRGGGAQNVQHKKRNTRCCCMVFFKNNSSLHYDDTEAESGVNSLSTTCLHDILQTGDGAAIGNSCLQIVWHNSVCISTV